MGAFLAGPVGSFLRVLAATMLTAWVLDLTETGNIDFAAWQPYLVAGLISALPILVAALNPADDRFGKTDTPPAGDGR